MKKFTADELREFDGSDETKPIYFAYKGKVYDATKSPLFLEGMHFEHPAGDDLTEYMDDAPHGDEALHDCPVIGEYEE
ncbi:MAG: cytochrome B5 [Deltaproteobacteria bacterium]|nr:cytochrome B5 [Deltaproteobacteria bacterium]